jgi:hypothetical protein
MSVLLQIVIFSLCFVFPLVIIYFVSSATPSSAGKASLIEGWDLDTGLCNFHIQITGKTYKILCHYVRFEVFTAMTMQ